VIQKIKPRKAARSVAQIKQGKKPTILNKNQVNTNKETKPSSKLTRTIMYTCKSCVWSETKREKNGKRQGEFLIKALDKAEKNNPLPSNVNRRSVFCLNGCLKPCNISFRAQNKYTIRFGKLTTKHADDIIKVAIAYSASKDGNLVDSEIPKSLHDKISVRTPPPVRQNKL